MESKNHSTTNATIKIQHNNLLLSWSDFIKMSICFNVIPYRSHRKNNWSIKIRFWILQDYLKKSTCIILLKMKLVLVNERLYSKWKIYHYMTIQYCSLNMCSWAEINIFLEIIVKKNTYTLTFFVCRITSINCLFIYVSETQIVRNP